MNRTLRIDPDKISTAETSEDIGGGAVTFLISSYDMPIAVHSHYDDRKRQLLLKFEYVDNEPARWRPTVTQEGVRFVEGKHSNKILAIEARVGADELMNIEQLRLRLQRAIAERRSKQIQFDMNQDVVNEVLQKNLHQLVGTI